MSEYEVAQDLANGGSGGEQPATLERAWPARHAGSRGRAQRGEHEEDVEEAHVHRGRRSKWPVIHVGSDKRHLVSEQQPSGRTCAQDRRVYGRAASAVVLHRACRRSRIRAAGRPAATGHLLEPLRPQRPMRHVACQQRRHERGLRCRATARRAARAPRGRRRTARWRRKAIWHGAGEASPSPSARSVKRRKPTRPSRASARTCRSTAASPARVPSPAGDGAYRRLPSSRAVRCSGSLPSRYRSAPRRRRTSAGRRRRGPCRTPGR